MLAYLHNLPTCWHVISTLISVQSLLIAQLDQPSRSRVTPAVLYPYRLDSLMKILRLSTLISLLYFISSQSSSNSLAIATCMHLPAYCIQIQNFPPHVILALRRAHSYPASQIDTFRYFPFRLFQIVKIFYHFSNSNFFSDC